MVDPSYNKFSAIAIGGIYTNNIDTSFGNVSLDVSGHVAIRGNLFVAGTANIDVSGGGFSGNDLSLNGNIYLGNSFYSTAPDGSFNIYSNAITHKSKDGATTFMFQEFTKGPNDVQWDFYKNFTQTTADGYYLNMTSGASIGFDASLDVTFTARSGVMNFYAEQNSMLFDVSQQLLGIARNGSIYLTSENNDIYFEASQNLVAIAENGDMNFSVQQGGVNFDVSNSFVINTRKDDIYLNPLHPTTNGNIWLNGNVNLGKPMQVRYYPVFPNYNFIGWTQNANYGTSYTGTASDNPATISQVGTFTLPSQGVWMIQFTCEITLNTGSDTITNKRIVLSDNTASATECAPGFSMYIELDDAAGGSGLRNIYNFSGIYHYGLSGTTANKYINVCAPTSGSRTVTASGDYKYTRIA